MEGQIIEIKGVEHPDSLADVFADVAINAIEDFNPDIYASVDKSYLKGGRFPVFNIQGYMSFDFREYEKEYRYDLFSYVSKRVKQKFNEFYPDLNLGVKFNLNLEPSSKDILLKENRFVDTAYVTYANHFTERENDMTSLAFFIDNFEDVSKDYKLLLVNDKLIINQTFYDNNHWRDNLSIFNRYTKDVNEFIKDETKLNDIEIIINPDKEISYIFTSRYGSSLFFNSCGAVGRGNQWFGFTSPQRYMCETPYGKHRLHPAKYLVNLLKNNISIQDTEEKHIVLYAEIGNKLDDYTVIKYKK